MSTLFLFGLQEIADNVSPDSTSPSKDALLEEACKKYDEATRLCPTLHDVCMLVHVPDDHIILLIYYEFVIFKFCFNYKRHNDCSECRSQIRH